MPEQPHFAYPFRFVNGRAATNQQDSADDVADCVTALLLCPVGARVEAPDFGVPDQVFSQGGADRQVLAQAITRWEPRATAQVARALDPSDPFVDHVQVNL